MSTPKSRPVHPSVLSVFEGKTGVEHSTWARVTNHSLETTTTTDGNGNGNSNGMPDLVTANASTLSIYRVDEATGKMLLVHTYSNLAGNVCFLETLRVNDYDDDGDSEDIQSSSAMEEERDEAQQPTRTPTTTIKKGRRRRRRRADALLVGFCGHPRLAVIHVKPDLLLATTLLDLTPALTDYSHGAVTPLEQDLTANLFQRDEDSSHHHQATVSVVLGGGISLICLELKYNRSVGGWRAIEEPYILPLATLAQAIDKKTLVGQTNTNNSQKGYSHHNSNKSDTNNALLTQSIVTGFGDILSTAFLPGYLEPTMVVLHSNPYVGNTWTGRLGRDTEGSTGGTRYSLILTAITVTVCHQRSALLWSTEVPADAVYVYTCPVDAATTGASTSSNTRSDRDASSAAACLVHCVNSVVWISNTGQIQQCLAVNGWVAASLSTSYAGIVAANSWPFPKLSMQLDGAQFTPITTNTWFVVLRRGQVYLLQKNDGGQWSLMSLYQTVGAVGEISCMSICPMGHYSASSFGKDNSFFQLSSKAEASGKKSLQQQQQHAIGLLFVASRLGDSSLLGYALGETSVVDALQTEPGLGSDKKGLKKENVVIPTKEETADKNSSITAIKIDGDTAVNEEDYERILKLEEDALYGGTTLDEKSGNPDIVPPSDDDDEALGNLRAKRARFSNLLVVRSLRVLDSLTALGPLGPACLGPLAPSPEVVIDPTLSSANTTPAAATTGQVFPCGYGSSGGLALFTVPGRDDRNILAEADCINAKALFSLPRRGLVLMSMLPEHGGTKVFKLEADEATAKDTLIEVDLNEWCTNEDTLDFFTACHLLLCVDLTDDSFLILVASPIDEHSNSYFIIILQQRTVSIDGKSTTTVRMKAANQLDIPNGEFITAAKAVEDKESDQVLLTYTVGAVGPTVVVITSDGSMIVKHSFSAADSSSEMDVTSNFDNEVETMSEEEKFYADRKIVSVDIFKAPKSIFAPKVSPKIRPKGSEPPVNDQSNVLTPAKSNNVMDEDDKELYYEGNSTDLRDERKEGTDDPNVEHDYSQVPDGEDSWYFATSRQSGELDIFLFSDLNAPVWSCIGCGHGTPSLQLQDQTPSRNPIGHKVYTREMKFFFCGPSSDEWGNSKGLTGPRPLCLMLETDDGDVQIYNADIHHLSLELQSFRRVPLKDVSRPSHASTKHFSKLRRKKMLSAKDGTELSSDFQHRRLFSFSNISGQDGAFVSVSRPFWLIAERGKPTVLHHRCRHVAPAGARPRPITGFCSGLSLSNRDEFSYVTVHERVGRVGSQRVSLFDGILNLASKNSLLPGGGLFVEKIPFGVTVRKIQFIDDGHPSTGSRPLYAVLVSREFEADLSELNDDGLSAEERQHIADEKENGKIQRQVEADLGGFDVEQEWVEEIERENCFKVDKSLGGAPPVPKSAYSLWIVDVVNGWQVVDSHELEDFEYGTSMEVVTLSDFVAEPGSPDYDLSEDNLDSKYFIAVGAGTIDKDGEDVACKGRVLLFEVNRPKDTPNAELNFVYEKKIFHGPVTSLSCLAVEGKSRLIIGAGADVNVEQWGNDKLTQVGFFRATMQVLDIKLFKNFFILSDAYDSLYFLVWRESDKSLTMLAKDYDPIPVYCSGILSRGGSLDFVCHDDRQNLQFFQYAPGDPAARGGNKLVCRADFHLGSQTTDLRSHFCRSSLLVNSATPASTLAALKQQDTFFGKADDDQKLAITFGTTDGGYCSVVPLSEPVYWRMTALQSVLVNALESDCALSQRAWRLYRRASRRGGCRNNDRKKGVIDGDLVLQYTDLSKADQEDLASAIGSTVDLILDNLLELRCSSMVL
jgi:cleavage and polyadenylation specificity factor subunit 1